MELGINLEYVQKRREGGKRTPEEAARLCLDAGFRYLDYSAEPEGSDPEGEAQRLRQVFDEMGVRVWQAHAPFFRYDPDGRGKFARIAPRYVRSAAALGAKYLVAHCDEYRPADDSWEPCQVLRRNLEILAPVAEYAGKLGVTLAVENLFEDGAFGSGRSRFCSTPEEVLAAAEGLERYGVGICWDFGHAKCAFGDQQEAALRACASRVVCTHVHDNYYGKDLHLQPFLGDIPWERLMPVLTRESKAEILSYEYVYGRIPDALLPAYLRLSRESGSYLLGLGD